MRAGAPPAKRVRRVIRALRGVRQWPGGQEARGARRAAGARGPGGSGARPPSGAAQRENASPQVSIPAAGVRDQSELAGQERAAEEEITMGKLVVTEFITL